MASFHSDGALLGGSRPEKVFCVGGARSGKSAFAESLAEAYPPPRLYLSTLVPFDAETRRRVAIHQERRGIGWVSCEAGASLADALFLCPEASCVLVDSLGTWISGLMCASFGGEAMGEEGILAGIDAFADAFQSARRPVMVVSDEAGLGLVPENAQARLFRDLLGLANQRLAEVSSDVFFVSCGLAFPLKRSGRPFFSLGAKRGKPCL